MHGLYCGLTLVIMSMICAIANSFYYEFPANQSFSPPYDPAHDPPDSMISLHLIFTGFSFVSCYACGGTLAFFMVIIDEKVKDFKLKKWQYFLLMVLSGFIFLSLVLWPFDDVKNAPDDRWGATSNSMYNAFAKTAWVKSPCFV